MTIQIVLPAIELAMKWGLIVSFISLCLTVILHLERQSGIPWVYEVVFFSVTLILFNFSLSGWLPAPDAALFINMGFSFSLVILVGAFVWLHREYEDEILDESGAEHHS